MNFKEILSKFRSMSFTEKEKGTQFERLIRSWLLTDPRYTNLEKVWLWEEFPCRKDFGGKDTGIDLVAKTDLGDYWAIQCKCYKEDAVINKPEVDSFLATSSRTFTDEITFQTTSFSNRIWVSTTNNWGPNAEEAIRNQNPPVNRISMVDFETSPVYWEKLLQGIEGKNAMKEGKTPQEHQLTAISKAHKHYLKNDRGKLIMACGTGKTFTSLKIAETILAEKGLVLFMVPSISLLGQSLNAWTADAAHPIKAVCICSDNKASRKMSKELDDVFGSSIDLALPASTDPKSIKRQLLGYRNHDGLVVVFSTYQSIESVIAAQTEILKATDNKYGNFDFIICDEAHRTTGMKLTDSDESNFTKIHSNENVKGTKRLYMTATPRLYGESAKIKASEKDCILCSMDDEKLYGEEFHRVNFSYAVQHGLLTDYKVLVLTVNEEDIPEGIMQDVKNGEKKELNYDDTSKLVGVINGLSKVIRGDKGTTWDADPRMMRRALAFCASIGDSITPGTSKNTASILPLLSEKYVKGLDPEEQNHVVQIKTRHIDGSMNSQERNQILSWLKDEPETDNECRVVTNVRCLSEGVDVPALDAVLFLSSRNSQVDVVQSVGRVMRNFRKGQPDEKKYGYIIIPIVVPMGVSPEDALKDNTYFKVVWDILNALRSHDDHFNAEVNKIALNKHQSTKVIVGAPGIGKEYHGSDQDQQDAKTLNNNEVARQLELRFGELQGGIYAKLVEKCGDRLYWENWAKEVGLIARKFIERISKLVLSEGKHQKEFVEFVQGLQKNLNPSVDNAQAIEMLAQHMITRPVFDALFADYQFVKNNAVSRSMQHMVELLEKEAMDKDTTILDKFYDSVRVNVGNIDNLEGKQIIIKNLYEKFFKGAFPLTVDKLGIVYTPVECVDFIIHSVDEILKKEFNSSLTEENVHILDPFTGTGTFITRLLQSGLIKPEDIERKYLNEIHCNEIVLLAYYIADVNIESVFHNQVKRDTYLPYDGICLTDTFQLNEDGDHDIFNQLFKENSERVIRQKKAPVRVIIGNPPYSVGQKSANDNAQNLKYEHLDSRISETYAKSTNSTNKNSLYDSYIKAFRWASDRISDSKDGGIVAFISNGAWIDGNAQDGMRKCMENEFSSIYILNLRGNQRTSGEISRKEGGKIFGSGSRTPIAITFLIKNPAHKRKAVIYYHDIGDYLSREQKLKMVKNFKTIYSPKLDLKILSLNEKADWINQRDGVFDSLIPIFPDKKFSKVSKSYFTLYSMGVGTSRDVWTYNFSKVELEKNMKYTISFYNEQIDILQEERKRNPNVELSKVTITDPKKISWSSSLLPQLSKFKKAKFQSEMIKTSLYRPFGKCNLYYGEKFIHRRGQFEQIFPTSEHQNVLICVSSVGSFKGLSVLITNSIPDLHLAGDTQCFPLYWYEENKNLQKTLFDEVNEDKYIRRDGITDWILKEIRNRFGNTRVLSKEHIFYYVYGLLHSTQYRERFASDLKKSLPRIPIVDTVEDFMAFYQAGKKLADLHLNYEHIAAYSGVNVVYGVPLKQESYIDDETGEVVSKTGTFKDFIVEKMRFPQKGQRNTIIYNGNIRIENIPDKAYEYVVNGKSAIEWIMERYQVSINKDSKIQNNPNDWSIEHNKPRYILDLLLSVINVSIQTVDIVNGLPNLKVD